MSHEAPQQISTQQEFINGMREITLTPEDEAYVAEMQREHNANRERIGRPLEDPAYEHILPADSKTGVAYKVDSAGHVHNAHEAAEDLGPYNKGRRY